jgi:phytoene dehydrogenase-like protein
VADADAIVVGAGVSGLFAALRLARRGVKVLVVEQNHQVGGLATSITRRGYTFDVGCQSVLDGGVLFPLLRELCADDDRWRRADFRVVSESGFDVAATSIDTVEAAFASADPGAGRGLRRAFDRHRRVAAFLRRLAAARLAELHTRPLGARIATLARVASTDTPMLLNALREPFESFYARLLPESRTRALLISLGYPRMSALLASAFWFFWCEDYWYPRGGILRWLGDLSREIEAAGGSIRCHAAVRDVSTERGRAAGVVLEDGTELRARAVVLAIDLPQALRYVAAAAVSKPPAIRGRLSEPMLTAFVGLRWTRDELRARIRSAHLFHFPARFHSLPRAARGGHRGQWIQIAAHSAFEERTGPAGVVVQTFTDPHWQNGFAMNGLPPLPRPAAYRELKRELAGELVEALDRALPGARDAAAFVDVGTPRTTFRFTRSPDGASAGFSYFFPDVPWRWMFRPRSCVRGVYLCGHTTTWPGSVATAALSGVVAADAASSDVF